MYCTNCGAEKGKKACPSCGQKKVKEIKFCGWCGSEIQQGYAVCTSCKEEVKPKLILPLLGNLALIVLFAVMLFRSFDAVGLMSLFAVIGIVLSLPAVRKIIIKKTHDKIEKRKKAHILRYVMIAVIFIACLSTINLTDYNAAINNFEEDPLSSLVTMESFGDYKDAPEKVSEFKKEILKKTETLIENGDFKTAKTYLETVGEFEGADKVKRELDYQEAINYDKNYEYGDAKKLFESVGDYKDAEKYLSKLEYCLIGNEYTHQSWIYYLGKNRLIYNTMIFYSVAPNVYISNIIKPKVYYGDGEDLNSSGTYRFKFEGNKLYCSSGKAEKWTDFGEFTSIVREGKSIKSFVKDGLKYELKDEKSE